MFIAQRNIDSSAQLVTEISVRTDLLDEHNLQLKEYERHWEFYLLDRDTQGRSHHYQNMQLKLEELRKNSAKMELHWPENVRTDHKEMNEEEIYEIRDVENAEYLLRFLGNAYEHEYNRDASSEELVDVSDEIRSTLHEFRFVLSALYGQNSSSLKKVLERGNSVMRGIFHDALIWLVPLLILLLLSVLLLNFFLRLPIRELAEASKKIRSGKFNISFEVDPSATDEISVLKRNFNITARRLDLMTSRLRNANSGLEQKAQQFASLSEQKTQLIRYLGHEMRAPLAAVSGMCELLMEGMAGDLSVKQEQYIGRIIRNSEYLLKMVSDLVDQAKAEAGMLKLELMPCDPSQILQEVLEVFEIKAGNSGINLSIQVPPRNRRTIKLDAGRIKQVLINLVGNAMKFTPEGGRISLVCRLGREGVHFIVRDSGIGIPDSEMSLIFQEFHQADTDKRKEGAGLGLPLSRNLVRLHGGDISVTSSLNKGSTFRVFLPYEAKGNNADPGLLDVANEVLLLEEKDGGTPLKS